MDYKLVYTTMAEHDLERLEQHIRKRILKKMRYFIESVDPFVHAKKLKNFDMDTYRFRVGDYRIIFRPDRKRKRLVILVVLMIAHRKEVY